MNTLPMATLFKALDAIGNALKQGCISFAEASKLRDLARAGRTAEVEKLLSALERKSRP